MKIEDIYGNLPILETKRLVLRKITFDDLEDIYYYGSKDEVTQYVFWDTHRSLSDTKKFVEFAQNQYKNKAVAPWGIEYKENGKFMGTVDFTSWQIKHKVAEIGYVISHDYWGRGIATEAAGELVRFGFKKMDLIRIQARCIAENIASARVMEKIGMTFEGTLRKAMYIKGKHRDFKMYSILKDEYEAGNKGI